MLPASANTKLTPIKFTLDFRVSGQVAPFFVALAKGYYREQGLDVSIDVVSGSVASITRVASGAYDMGFGDISSLIEFNADAGRADLVRAVCRYYNRAPVVIIGRRDRGLANDWHSVAGKRIAAGAVESTRRAWPMAAKQLGVRPDAFAWVTTDFSQRDLLPRLRRVAVPARAGRAARGAEGLGRRPAAPWQRHPHVHQAGRRQHRRRGRLPARHPARAERHAGCPGGAHRTRVEQQIASVSEAFGLRARPALEAVYDLRFLPPVAERTRKT